MNEKPLDTPLVERLHAAAKLGGNAADLCYDAAAEIKRLTKERDGANLGQTNCVRMLRETADDRDKEFARAEALSVALRGAEAKLNTPELHDFVNGAVAEAQHQRERWGTDHDEGKTPLDWLWLVAYLCTKATQAERYGDTDKYLHHIITAAAALANWHSHATGANTRMRPGSGAGAWRKVNVCRALTKGGKG